MLSSIFFQDKDWLIIDLWLFLLSLRKFFAGFAYKF